jgi:hypothetical protein
MCGGENALSVYTTSSDFPASYYLEGEWTPRESRMERVREEREEKERKRWR